jgi:hypothetical protein
MGGVVFMLANSSLTLTALLCSVLLELLFLSDYSAADIDILIQLGQVCWPSPLYTFRLILLVLVLYGVVWQRFESSGILRRVDCSIFTDV